MSTNIRDNFDPTVAKQNFHTYKAKSQRFFIRLCENSKLSRIFVGDNKT